MKAQFIQESIKHLKPRSEEEMRKRFEKYTLKDFYDLYEPYGNNDIKYFPLIFKIYEKIPKKTIHSFNLTHCKKPFCLYFRVYKNDTEKSVLFKQNEGDSFVFMINQQKPYKPIILHNIQDYIYNFAVNESIKHLKGRSSTDVRKYIATQIIKPLYQRIKQIFKNFDFKNYDISLDDDDTCIHIEKNGEIKFRIYYSGEWGRSNLFSVNVYKNGKYKFSFSEGTAWGIVKTISDKKLNESIKHLQPFPEEEINKNLSSMTNEQQFMYAIECNRKDILQKLFKIKDSFLDANLNYLVSLCEKNPYFKFENSFSVSVGISEIGENSFCFNDISTILPYLRSKNIKYKIESKEYNEYTRMYSYWICFYGKFVDLLDLMRRLRNDSVDSLWNYIVHNASKIKDIPLDVNE
jgi:hypothetical protein